MSERKQQAQKRAFKEYIWEVPQERLYDANTNQYAKADFYPDENA